MLDRVFGPGFLRKQLLPKDETEPAMQRRGRGQQAGALRRGDRHTPSHPSQGQQGFSFHSPLLPTSTRLQKVKAENHLSRGVRNQ